MARVLVVGGSLGGLMAAGVLHRAGHEVQVLERSPRSLQGRGAGIVTHDSLRDALRLAGVVVDDTLGVAVQSRVVLDRSGAAQCTWQHPQVLTSWGRLYALLSAAVPAGCQRLGAAVVSVQQDTSGVQATLATGETVQGELLIACDGLRSSVRGQMLSSALPAVQPQYAGYVAWRGVCDETVLSRHTRTTLFDHFGFGLPDGEQLIGYPVAGANDRTDVGHRRWNFVWYRPAAAGAALAALMTDADGTHHAEGIPPQQVSWRHIAAMRQAARDLLAPQFAEILEKTALPFLQPIFDLVSPQLAFGRVALLGDAAFVARPHVGMGVSKAGEDAMALAACIAQHSATPAALHHYDAERRPAGLAIVQRARWLGAYLQGQAPETDNDPGRRARRAQEVMQQTAIEARHFQHALA